MLDILHILLLLVDELEKKLDDKEEDLVCEEDVGLQCEEDDDL